MYDRRMINCDKRINETLVGEEPGVLMRAEGVCQIFALSQVIGEVVVKRCLQH